MAEKKKNPRFGGKRDLKDISGNQKIGFEDTFLGDLLGFDGKMGTKGKPGLLASLKGARRKKPGTATTTTTKKKPTVKKNSSSMSDAQKRRQVSKTTSPTVSDEQKRRQTKTPKVNFAATGGVNEEQRRRQQKTPKKNTSPTVSDEQKRRSQTSTGGGSKSAGSGRSNTVLPSSPAQQKRAVKDFTLERYNSMTLEQKRANRLPTSKAALARLFNVQVGTPKFNKLFKQSSGMNKGGMAKKKGYAAGGMPMVMKGGKKVPSFAADGIGKMNMGGMAKKKPAAKMMAGGMAKKKPTAKMMGGGMAKSGYMYGGSVTKKKPVTKMNKGGMTKKK